MSKSYEVDYAFGQLGSVYTNLAKPVYPPKDKVIVAIQFLADATMQILHTERLDGQGMQYITTEDTEATDCNYLGVTEAACTGVVSTVNFTNDTVTIGAEDAKIKPGQYVLLVNDSDTINVGLTVDGETKYPIYNGSDTQGVKVVSVNRDLITLSEALTPTSSQTLVFIDEQHGAGGTNITAGTVVFPKGLTIYGRWTNIQLGADDADGGIICYFGE